MNKALAMRDDDNEDNETKREEDHKLWPNARLGLLHLVAMLESDEYRFEPTPRMKLACGITSDSHWKKVHELMRGWLADQGYDLVNHFSREGGYAIARYPVQTFREVLKSTFRSLGHLGSAHVRSEKLNDWLDKLTGDSAMQHMKFREAMGFLMVNAEHMKKRIREIEHNVPEMNGVDIEVSNIPDKLLARDESRAKFIQPEEAVDLEIAALKSAMLATRVR